MGQIHVFAVFLLSSGHILVELFDYFFSAT